MEEGKFFAVNSGKTDQMEAWGVLQASEIADICLSDS